jgi:hypothetical protein
MIRIPVRKLLEFFSVGGAVNITLAAFDTELADKQGDSGCEGSLCSGATGSDEVFVGEVDVSDDLVFGGVTEFSIRVVKGALGSDHEGVWFFVWCVVHVKM